MIRLRTNKLKLSADAQTWLVQTQAIVNDPRFDRALLQSKWKNRDRKVFAEIKRQLLKASKAKRRCWYCEANEQSVVDHIAPKSKFPTLTFHLDNFVLACDQCNTHHKQDQFAVFLKKDSPKVTILKSGSRPNLPPNVEFAFIHAHKDDPFQYLKLNLQRGVFAIHSEIQEDPRAVAKVKQTLRILGLNKRPVLVKDRCDAMQSFISRLQLYAAIEATSSAAELIELIPIPDDSITEANFLKSRKNALKNAKRAILSAGHITVLHEMSRQAPQIPSLQRFKPLIKKLLA